MDALLVGLLGEVRLSGRSKRELSCLIRKVIDITISNPKPNHIKLRKWNCLQCEKVR